MQNSDLLTLIAFGLAIFVIYKLRSVLGQRTGTERPMQDLFAKNQEGAGENNVVPMRGAKPETTIATPEPEVRLASVVPADSPAFAGLVEMMKIDPDFNALDFKEGAKSAYEMIVLAFANGDRATLKDLLAKDVFDGFEGAIKDRESRNEKIETQFVSIDKADIVDAMVRARNGQVTMKFVTKLITATRDAAGTVIDGSPEKVIDVTDIWTFSRDLSTRDPNWRLIATESAQ
jgi:predicted lipid-binding transport protein (Tim44 family)